MPESAIATPQLDATRTGAEILAAGGNAIDAALAAAAVLTVAYPHNCALGGDLFALVRRPDGTTVSVNASGPAAAAVDAAAVLAAGGPAMPVTGPCTVTVPGLVAGWGTLHELGASRPWAAHLEAAATLAEDGVAVVGGLAGAIAGAEQLHADPGMRAVFAPDGEPLPIGATLRQPSLARSLRHLAAEGPRALYDGELAQAFVRGLTAAGCLLSAADLEAFAPATEDALRGRYAGVEVLTSPPNSSGVLLLQALAAIEASDLADPLGAGAAQVAAILRSGSAQRERDLADPRSQPFDPAVWLGEDRIAELAEAARAGGSAPAGAPARARPSGDTVAVVAVDGEGRAVSLIQSLYHFFGAQILEPATGILVHNRGSSFSLAPGHPNRLAPGRRPAHTLMPVLVERGGRLLGALGTMGGRVQAQIHTQVLLRLLGGHPPQAAVDAPRWVVGALEAGEADGTLRIEEGVTPAARQALRRLDQRVIDVPRGSSDFGHCHAIWTDGGLLAGSDARADGDAAIV